VIESAQGVQQGALAGAVGAEDAPGLAGFHAQAERPAVGAFGDVDDEFAGLEYAHQRLRYSSTREGGHAEQCGDDAHGELFGGR